MALLPRTWRREEEEEERNCLSFFFCLLPSFSADAIWSAVSTDSFFLLLHLLLTREEEESLFMCHQKHFLATFYHPDIKKLPSLYTWKNKEGAATSFLFQFRMC